MLESFDWYITAQLFWFADRSILKFLDRNFLFIEKVREEAFLDLILRKSAKFSAKIFFSGKMQNVCKTIYSFRWKPYL